MAETETVGLNLTGTFAAMAEADAAAADKLAGKLDKLNAAGAKAPKTRRGDVDATLKDQEKALKDREKALKDQQAAQDEWNDGLAKMNQSSMSQGHIALAVAGAAVSAASVVADKIHAAVEEATAVIKLLGLNAGQFVIEGTSAKESFLAVMEGMGKTEKQAAVLYKQIAAQAIATGRDKSAIASEFKRLAGAGYKAAELDALSRLLGDIEAAKGSEKANALLTKLEQVKAKGIVNEESVNGLAEAGISADAVYKRLAANLGKSVAQVKTDLKTGKVSVDQFTKAVQEAVSKQLGGVAAKQADSLLSLIARIKNAGMELFVFDEGSVSPLKGTLKGVLAMLTSGMGKQIKSGLEGVGKEVFEAIFGPLNEATAQDAGKAVVEALAEVKAAVSDVKPEIRELIQMLREMAKAGDLKLLVGYLKTMGSLKLGELKREAKGAEVKGGAFDEAKKVLKGEKPMGSPTGPGMGLSPEVTKLLGGAANDNASAAVKDTLMPGLADTAAEMPEGGNLIGKGITDGMLGGIAEGSPEVEAAAAAMAERALERAKSVLGVHSPSEEFKEVGQFSDEGMAKGFGGGKSTAAAAGMANDALGAAQAAAGGAGGGSRSAGGGGGAGGGITINIVLGPGSGAAQGAAAKAEIDKGLPGWLAMQRRASRDAAEAA